MKTPEEIKRGLEHCASYNPCFQCDYDARDWPRCVTRLHGDAKAYIQQLEREREVMIERVKGSCYHCKHGPTVASESPCADCIDGRYWEWRGVEDENHET